MNEDVSLANSILKNSMAHLSRKFTIEMSEDVFPLIEAAKDNSLLITPCDQELLQKLSKDE